MPDSLPTMLPSLVSVTVMDRLPAGLTDTEQCHLNDFHLVRKFASV